MKYISFYHALEENVKMHTIVKLDKVYNTFLEFVQVKNIKGPIDKKEGCVYYQCIT